MVIEEDVKGIVITGLAYLVRSCKRRVGSSGKEKKRGRHHEKDSINIKLTPRYLRRVKSKNSFFFSSQMWKLTGGGGGEATTTTSRYKMKQSETS